jgi:nitroreductase
MDIYEAIETRRSVRRYRPNPVPEEKIERILEAARWAPSWRNGQPWHFIVVREESARKTLTKGVLGLVTDAPIYVVACGDPAKSAVEEGKDYYLVDVAIAMEYLILAATAEGLGTCWVGGMFSEEGVKKVLSIPEDIQVVALTPLGYPSEGRGAKAMARAMYALVRSRTRKPPSEIVHLDRWGQKLKQEEEKNDR